ncbi:hypothetical protein FRC01_006005, partial [Tulasnella sp. 417]
MASRSDSHAAGYFMLARPINMPGGTDAIFNRDVEEGLRGAGANTAVIGGTHAKPYLASETNARNATETQFYDDEEWANGLRGEDIEAVFETAIRRKQSFYQQGGEAQSRLSASTEGGLLGGSADASRSSLKRPSPIPDAQEN